MNRRLLVLVTLACWITTGAALGADLRVIQTAHYIIHSDLEEELTHDLCDRIEAMYGEYAQRLSAFSGPTQTRRMEIFLFEHEKDYSRFVGGNIRNTSGIFLPNRNELAAFLDDQGRQQLRRTLQHEAFHQFAYNAISPDLPIWLNEGLAQYFEEGLWNGSKLQLGEAPPRRVRQLQADLKNDRLIAFVSLLPMTEERWAHRLFENREAGSVQYNQSWAMVHFLVTSQDAHGEYLYRGHLLEMLRLLHEHQSPAAAFEAAFGSNIRGFQEKFVAYVRTLKATPEATLIENQSVLADLLSILWREGRRFGDMESFRQFLVRGHFKMHYELGNLKWDTDPNINVYFSDLAGNRLAGEDLYLLARDGAPVPDIICHADGLALCTRFYDGGPRSVDRDTLIAPVGGPTALSNSIAR